MLNKAEALATDHFSFAELGEIASQLGDAQTSESSLQQAAGACNNPSQAMQLAARLSASGIATDQVKKLYTSMKNKFTDPKDLLSWSSGIVQIFKDQEWAAKEYDELASTFASGIYAKRFKANKASNLERSFW